MSLPMRHSLVVATLGILLLAPRPAAAFDFSLKLEPGIAIPLTSPQTDHFRLGGGGFGRIGFGVVPYIDLQIAGGGFGFPTKDADGVPVVIGAVGGGLRLQLPHEGKSGPRKYSPWIDADMLYVRTGGLDRAAFDVGAGIGFSPGTARSLWLGVFARYLQVLQPNNIGFDNADAKIFLAGLYIEFHPVSSDSDHDGVPDSRDACPKVFGPAENNGCPWLDADGDGVTDNVDRCLKVPGPADNQGCPWPDSDGDGTLDRDDKCPQTPGDAANAGCPWPDSDGDGVADKDDKCPGIAGPPENSGCPWPDTDGDGVLDRDDRCPQVKGPADNGGCPRYTKVTVTENKIEILEKIFFAFDKSTILERSFPLLDEVVKAMTDHATLYVRIEGYTDSKGSNQHNQALSEGRANAVMKYLTTAGIASTRLYAKGFGPSAPLETNATAQGRERNRRVEFVIVKKPD